MFSNIPAARKVFDLAEKGEGFQCVQYAGDVVLAPPYWGHLTYNLATSIGMAKEFIINPPPNKMIKFTQMKRDGKTSTSTSKTKGNKSSKSEKVANKVANKKGKKGGKKKAQASEYEFDMDEL